MTTTTLHPPPRRVGRSLGAVALGFLAVETSNPMACRRSRTSTGAIGTPPRMMRRTASVSPSGTVGVRPIQYANNLAAVHTILKRLNESGELRFIPRAPGQHQYTLNRASTDVALGPDIVKYMREHRHEREAMQATNEDPPPPRPAQRTRRAR